MPLPREPRQKMINVMYLVLTAILALNVSNEVITAFKVVDKSLITSNEVITDGNATIYKSLKDKVDDPQTAKNAAIWEPKAAEAKVLSDEIYVYIDSLKMQLKRQAGLRIKDDGTEDFREENLDAATRLFMTEGKGKELEAKLNEYKEAMLSIDPSIRERFAVSFPISTNTESFVTREGKSKDFTQTYFNMTPTVSALTMLSKFQNGVRTAESEIITHCHNQIGAVKVVYDQFAALVGQTSNYLMPGQKMTVTAGVGAYSTAAQPEITIGGNRVPVGPDGVATHTITAAGAGVHKMPVTVTYTKPDGEKETKSFPVEYTVGTPGGAAVMLDKMNVFYRFVDNPVTISSGTGWDKTKVSMTGGSLVRAGGPGKYVVKVEKLGNASISVNSDGKLSTYSFRIKDIPDPVFKVGPNASGRVQSVVFKNQRFARADLENFDFEYKYNIVGATVYFTGANFPNPQQVTITSSNLGPLDAMMQKCIPGTTVTFDNVRVQGPGGPVRSIPGGGFLLY